MIFICKFFAFHLQSYSVPVAIWSVSENDERALDHYEGFPTFYYKKKMPVTVKGIKSGKEYRRNAFAYIMHEERPIGIPSLQYMRTCAEGYCDFGFDQLILAEAFTYSRKETMA